MSEKVRLTPRQERFVREYLVDQNGTAAYRRAFPGCAYTTARTEASRLLANPNIRAEVEAARRDQRKRTRVSADRVLRGLAEIAFSDLGDVFDLSADVVRLLSLRDIPPDVRRAIASFKVKRVSTKTWTAGGGETVTETVEVVEVRMWSKLRALDMLARHHGLYKELPPLETLLSLLPRDMATAVRRTLADELERTGEQPNTVTTLHPDATPGLHLATPAG